MMRADLYDVLAERIGAVSAQGTVLQGHVYDDPRDRTDRSVRYISVCTCGWLLVVDDYSMARALWFRHVDEVLG